MLNNGEEISWEKMQQLIQISVQAAIAAVIINMSTDSADSSDSVSLTDSANSVSDETESNSSFRP